jgi:hypothetical protein
MPDGIAVLGARSQAAAAPAAAAAVQFTAAGVTLELPGPPAAA